MQPQVRRPPVTAAGPTRRTHRLRALILLTLLVATPVVWGAHLFGTLLLWPTMTVTMLLLVDLLYVRAVVGRERIRRRRALPHADRQPAARPAARPAPRRVVKPPAATRPASVSRTAPAAPAAEAPVHSQEAVTEVIVRDEGWQPVAVPRPTYAMKAKADRPTAAPAAMVVESDSAPVRRPEPSRPAAEPLQPAVAVDEFDLDAVLDRRRAAGA